MEALPDPELKYFRLDFHGNIDAEFTAQIFASFNASKEKFNASKEKPLKGSAAATLYRIKKIWVCTVGPIPVVFTADNPVKAAGELNVEAGLEYSNSWAKHFEVGVKFENGKWSGVNEFTDSKAEEDKAPCSVSDNANFKATFEVMGGVKFESKIKLYGVVGPIIELAIMPGLHDGELTYNRADGFEFKAVLGIKFTADAKVALEIPVLNFAILGFEPEIGHYSDIFPKQPLHKSGLAACPAKDDKNEDDKKEDGKKGRYLLSGVVKDAATGDPLPGVRLQFIAKGGHGDIEFVNTNKNGEYFITLDEDQYEIRATHDGYVEYTEEIHLDQAKKRNITLTKPVESTEYRVILNWNETPTDLDSHLLGASGVDDGQYDYHLYFRNMAAYGEESSEIATLDVDDTNGEGPETVTFKASDAGKYTYYIHNYSRENYGDLPLKDSGATVELYKGDKLVKKYAVPTDFDENSNIWGVFTIDHGEVKDYLEQTSATALEESKLNAS